VLKIDFLRKKFIDINKDILYDLKDFDKMKLKKPKIEIIDINSILGIKLKDKMQSKKISKNSSNISKTINEIAS
jgi:choline kinase